MAQLSTSASSVPHVPTRMEIQRISNNIPPGLQGLPPLPKSLSGVNLLLDSSPPPPPAPTRPMRHPPPPPPVDQGSGVAAAPLTTVASRKSPAPSTPNTLDSKLALLRKEMYGLRQLDLTLLSQLWTLNESIQEFRAMQEALSPQSDLDETEDSYLYGNIGGIGNMGTLSNIGVIGNMATSFHRSSSSSNSSTVDFTNL